MLKIFYRIAFVSILAVFVSCDNEPLEGFDLTEVNQVNQETPAGVATNATSIEGTWKLTAWNAANAVDINNDGTASINLLDELNCYDNETIVFNSDNTAISMSTTYAEIELFIVVGTTNQYTFTSTCVPEIENTNLTWVQSGNLVTTTDVVSGGTINFTLNGNQLSFLIPNGFDVSNGSGTATVTEDLTFVYTKQ